MGGAIQPRKMASARPQPGKGLALEFMPMAQLKRATAPIKGEELAAALRHASEPSELPTTTACRAPSRSTMTSWMKWSEEVHRVDGPPALCRSADCGSPVGGGGAKAVYEKEGRRGGRGKRARAHEARRVAAEPHGALLWSESKRGGEGGERCHRGRRRERERGKERKKGVGRK
eukprot:scaffold207097_cov31-Tisochrysis_lutea.AAC.1